MSNRFLDIFPFALLFVTIVSWVYFRLYYSKCRHAVTDSASPMEKAEQLLRDRMERNVPKALAFFGLAAAILIIVVYGSFMRNRAFTWSDMLMVVVAFEQMTAGIKRLVVNPEDKLLLSVITALQRERK